MGMGVDKPGHDTPARRVNHSGSLGGTQVTDGRDALARNADIGPYGIGARAVQYLPTDNLVIQHIVL